MGAWGRTGAAAFGAACLVAAAATTAVHAAAQPGGSETRCAEAAPLAGTFLQPTTAVVERDAAAWEALFAEIAALGMREVYLQWTAANGVYESGVIRWPRSPAELAKRTLDAAEKHGLRVWLGLAYTDAWWQRIDRSRPQESVDVYLRRRLFVNDAAAQAVAPVALAHPAFAGWYVTDEIDDRNWLEPARRAALAGYLGALSSRLRELAPGRTIAISGFATGFADPGSLAAQWTAILEAAAIDVLLLQDGIGAGHLEEPELATLLPPLREAVAAAGRRLGFVVELFTAEASSAPAATTRGAVEKTAPGDRPVATGGDELAPVAGGAAPVADGEGADDGAAVAGGTTSFRAHPAPLARIEKQIAFARRWATGPLVAFSVPDYMSTFAGGPALRLYEKFLARAESCRAR